MKTLILLMLCSGVASADNANSFVEGFANGLRHSLEAKQGYQSPDYVPPASRPEPVYIYPMYNSNWIFEDRQRQYIQDQRWQETQNKDQWWAK